MFESIRYFYNVYFLWPIQHWLNTVQPIPPYQSACTGNCNQGRNCDCDMLPDLDDDEEDFVINESWPFPTQPKP